MGEYDYLIVGAGLFGSTFAHQMKMAGKRCLVLDKRSHIAGSVYCENVNGINVHRYGAHIFHTSNKEVWDYINQFAQFNSFINSPVAVYKDELYNLPFTMNTFAKLWGVKTPVEAKEIIDNQIKKAGIIHPKNLEEKAICLVGTDIYEKLIKGYTQKQWGRECNTLPAFIIERLPLRFTYDNNYFNDIYQGIPIGGYTKIVEKMLFGCEVLLNTDYFDFIKAYPKIAKKIVFSGMIDRFFNYSLGALEYRSIRFEDEFHESKSGKNGFFYQDNAVVNFTDIEVPYTRIIEHKHFEYGNQPFTVISKEYSLEFKQGREPYYPINDERNNRLYEGYKSLAAEQENVIFGGRLGEYKYYNMDKVVELALAAAKKSLDLQ